MRARRRRPGVTVGGLALLAGLAVLVLAQGPRATGERAAQLEAMATTAQALAARSAPLFRADTNAADTVIREWAAAAGLRVTLIAADGIVHADSWTLPALLGRLENHGRRPEVLEAARAGVGSARRRSVTTDDELLYVAHVVGPIGAPVGFLRIAGPPSSLPVPVYGLLAVALAALVAGGVAAAWDSRRHRLVARHLAPWTELGETAELAALAEEADRAFRAERESMTRSLDVTRAALGEVSEGVLLLDRSGTVRFANPAAAGLLGPELAVDRPLLETARSPDLLSAFERTLAGGTATHTSLAGRDGAELAVRVCALPHPVLAAAIVLRDVSGERRLERARRALVADLAHELRTPLTVLGGVAEELGEEAVAPGLVASLERQIARLRAFAEELEDLAAIEAGQVRLQPAALDVAEIARQVVGDLAEQAARAGVELVLEGQAARLETDPLRLAQVIGNVVDNAIRYNRSGGKVSVRVRAEGEGALVTVQDTGMGIPAADLPLVFQRFYRVRRGPQTSGGSGLGLAIVKHLTRALGGTVQLRSEEGAGTEVTLRFPARVEHESSVYES